MLAWVNCSHWDGREALSTALVPGGGGLAAQHRSQEGLALGDVYEPKCIRTSLLQRFASSLGKMLNWHYKWRIFTHLSSISQQQDPLFISFTDTTNLYVDYWFSHSVSFIAIKSLISSHVLLSIISCQQGSHSYRSFSLLLCPVTGTRTSLLAETHGNASQRYWKDSL